MSFTHLHVHTQYSLLQGAIRMDELVEQVKAMGMSSVAITDTHNLFGAIDFYLAAKKAGIKPIIGCEIIYAPLGKNSVLNQNGKTGNLGAKFHHLVLLCKNIQGYHQLCEMISRSYTETPPPQKGAPVGPRAWVDRELLDRYGNDLIVLSGCVRGEIPSKIIMGDEAGALEAALWFKKRFGEDFYLELQESGLPEQSQANEVMQHWAEKNHIQCVATVDCHYLKPEDSESHEVLQCIEHGRNLDLDRPKSLVPPEFFLKTPAQMEAAFARYPEAILNTLKVSEKCDLQFQFKDDQGRPIYHLPDYIPSDLPSGTPSGKAFDLVAYFRDKAHLGLKERLSHPSLSEREDFKDLKKSYLARLEDELSMIERTGFAGYFLIVADFVNWAKAQGIPVGPGRGSGVGSLVAYSLKITDVDPIAFKLLFERFINPERISMPDFDIDFCQDRRGEVIDYVSKKYGAANVCQIITFGKLQARAVIKDVARVLGLSFADSDQITKLLPEELDITVETALVKEPKLKEKMASDVKVAKVIEYSLALEGLYRNAGKHAAGVIITQKPIVNYAPLYVGRDGDVVVQFDKDYSEAIGLVKFDFLGLKTLTVIDNAVKLVRANAEPGTSEEHFKLETIPYNDAKVFSLISSGDTDGVFQVESSGMKDLCTRMQPSSLEDLTAINGLYRPGPLGSGMVDDFIDRKHGRQKIAYDVEALASILDDTYGIILYQEQVMQIARELAGYSLGQADLLRRAMGKKKPEEMAKHREIFVKGAVAKNIAAPKAEAIFDLMAKFAEYGFNKSHSAAYGVLTYQTAFLKTHYPAEFMAALMTTEMDNTDKITRYIGDAKSHDMLVLPPDVNYSQKRFSVERVKESGKKGIRFGLEGIKGVGGIAVDAILEARVSQPFKNVIDFCRRVPTRKVNKKVLESLTLAGAFDSIAEVNRASLFSSLETLLETAGDEQAERELGQSSLFDSFGSDEVKLVTPSSRVFKAEEDWPSAKKLAFEKQVVGFYISGHPLETWQKIGEDWLGWNTERIKLTAQEKSKQRAQAPASFEPAQYGRNRVAKTEVKLIGLLGDMREVMTKKGTRMAFAQLEDLKGKIEVVFFPDTYTETSERLKKAVAEVAPVVITAEMEPGEESPKLLVKNLEWAEDAHKGRVNQVVLRLKTHESTPEQLRALKQSLLEHRGKCPVRIDFVDRAFKTRLDLPSTVKVAPTPQMVARVNGIFGREVVTLH